MTILKVTPGKYLNSPVTVMTMSCPYGNFKNFSRAYYKELCAVSDKVVGVSFGEHDMEVEFTYGKRIYKEIPE